MPQPSALMSLATLRHHRWVRRGLWALLALLLLWLLSWLSVPALVKGPLERIASEQLGRPLTVGAIEFTPWTLEVTLRDIAIGGAQGGPPQLTIARVYADAELQSLLRLAPVVDALEIDAPHLRLTHLSDGHYDVDDILARLTAPSDKPASGPARLALHNLTLNGGAIDFDDRTVNKIHAVRQLALTVPFISTLPAQREIKVEPHLSFEVGGSRFDSSAQATPFAQTGKGDATVKWEGLDLAPYLPYLPASLPVRVQGAVLDLDLKVAFEQAPRLAVTLSGQVQTRNVQITDRNQQPLLSYERLTVDMADVRPLDQVVRLARVELAAPIVTATRNARGEINLAQLAAPAASTAKPTPPAAPAPQAPASGATPPASGATSPASGASSATPPATAPGWTMAVAQAAVRQGQLRWSDQSTQPAAALQATDLTLDVADVAYPFKAPLTFTGALGVQGSTLSFKGQATDRAAEVNLSAHGLALQLAAPYLAQTLEPALTGQISGEMAVQWQAPAGDAAKAGATGITLGAGPLALEQLALQQGKTTLASVGKLALDGLKLNLDTRTVDIERLGITQPKATVERAADGRWMAERWLKAAPAATPARSTTAAAPAWRVRLGELAVDEGIVAFADRAQPRPVALNLSALSLQARNLALDGSKPEALSLSTRVAAGRGNAGKLDYRGTLTPQPFATQGRLEASRLPLHALDGYLADQFAIELLRADVGFRGQVAVAQSPRGTTLRVNGDAAIDELRANSTAAATPKTAEQVGEELLAWKSLGLRGLSVALAPNTAPRVEVKETSLADFYARITINENGRINLSDIAKSPAEVNNTPAAAAQPPAKSAPADTVASASSPPPPSPQPPPDPLAPVVVFGPVSLVNGKVLFSDFFIKPNYSADLTELTGKLSAFSSQPAGSEPVLADLELRGRAEGSASLEITGKLNPLAKPLALDIVGKVRDLELPPLSPYSVKYAGHGIERGKLSMDVAYKVLPNGQLTASNKLVLNQLTFGDPVEGAPNSLPVRLAVALLADSHGVIDLDLPISGSLNDPQFRIGPVIFKIIVNLIGKAITAPFSLLARAFGGGDELSSVAFAPGSATLTPEARQNLDKVAKALTERPALKITVTGTASLERERDAIQRERLQELVRAAKRRATPADTTPVQAAEYPALLKEVYRRADMPKPRNLVGMAKDLPVPEMEALLLAHLPAATEDLATELATHRGQAVKAYLAEQKLPDERLFLAAPKTTAADDKWTPQAQLSLATQ
ncbi:hypothetical protein CBP36_16835 [Acidovorax carolinensis]|uniref:Uncharacterized protein n=1 Tax=Acidovorax carolinensis TaxID=553814 RepID=A0A240UGW8_9BURK|nr:DUF748 domain-containing protein [Acidovorax carolinensis]ART54118.1 hypothetical protein CBP35_02085 [Acidovorax carolinensis]ART60260.1 hypothetical protein CBP36_16835 [Acidovorax carolinensis]